MLVGVFSDWMNECWGKFFSNLLSEALKCKVGGGAENCTCFLECMKSSILAGQSYKRVQGWGGGLPLATPPPTALVCIGCEDPSLNLQKFPELATLAEIRPSEGWRSVCVGGHFSKAEAGGSRELSISRLQSVLETKLPLRTQAKGDTESLLGVLVKSGGL